MSIATEVAAACAGATAYTLYGGYAVHDGGQRKLFTGCRVTKEARNARGRVTRMEGVYSDGSTIVFTYSETRGPRLQTALSAAK